LGVTTRAREQSFLRNFEMFGAPHAALIFMPSYFGLREAADCGMYAQNLMLALTAHGMGSCAQGALSHYMPTVREVLGIGPDLICLFGLSFGYPDYSHPSDAARTFRAPLAETTIFHD
jgi:nitroreductase